MSKQPYGNVQVEWTKEKTEQVQKKLVNFFNKHRLYSGESLCQDDGGNIFSPDCMGDIADILFEDMDIDYGDGEDVDLD